MPFIDTIPESEIGADVRAMYERQQTFWGFVPNYAKVFCWRPEIMGLWAQLQGSASGLLLNTAQGQPYRNCRIGQPHRGYIDYILLGGALRESLLSGSFERLSYAAADAWRLKLSDHCPVAVKLRID